MSDKCDELERQAADLLEERCALQSALDDANERSHLLEKRFRDHEHQVRPNDKFKKEQIDETHTVFSLRSCDTLSGTVLICGRRSRPGSGRRRRRPLPVTGRCSARWKPPATTNCRPISHPHSPFSR